MCSVSSVAQSCLTLCGPMDYSTPGFLSVTNFQSLLKLMSIESVMSSDRLILCFPLLLLPSIFPSIRVFSNESVLHITYQSIGVLASASVLPMNTQGWISFRMDWLDLLAVQGTLKSLLQHHSSKASILRPSAFFMCSDPIFCKVQSLRCNSYNLGYKEPYLWTKQCCLLFQ